jgi:hypothetical protein
MYTVEKPFVKLYAYPRKEPMNKKTATPKKKYPDIYEKGIPVIIGVIVVIISGMLILTLGIAFGVIQGT